MRKKLVLKRFTVTHSTLSNSEYWPRVNMGFDSIAFVHFDKGRESYMSEIIH